MENLSVFEHINENLESLEIDEIVELLGPLKIGMEVHTPIIPSGEFLYRGRKIDSDFSKENGITISDLTYPSAEKAKLGRLNRDGSPIFYCSVSKEVVFFEIPDLTDGDEIILSYWQTSERMVVNNIGYTQSLFDKLGAKRECPIWSVGENQQGNAHQEIISDPDSFTPNMIEKALSRDENSAIRQAFSDAFMCEVGLGERHRYKLSTAIGELHLGEIVNSTVEFSGVMYPTMRMWANSDNLALLPAFVDKNVEFRMAMHVRIDSKTENKFSITKIDSAIKVSDDGTLNWLGRLPNWTLGPESGSALVVATTGRDKFGDYTIGQDGTPLHWVLTDQSTGNVIEPS